MTIKTETDHAGTDLNEVIGILHKQLERGYVSAYQAIALAELVTKAREDTTAPFLELADYLNRPLLSERESGVVSEMTDAFQRAAALIRRTAEGKFPRRQQVAPVDRCGEFLCENAMSGSSLRCEEHERAASKPAPHEHEWTKVGGPGDEWRVCFLCDVEDDE